MYLPTSSPLSAIEWEAGAHCEDLIAHGCSPQTIQASVLLNVNGISSLGHFRLPTLIAALHSFSDRAHALHDAIEKVPQDVDLSDPTTFVQLPFPSLRPASDQ